MKRVSPLSAFKVMALLVGCAMGMGWLNSTIAQESQQPSKNTKPTLAVSTTDHAVVVAYGSVELLHYVFRDTSIARPYFAHIKTLSGSQVSRNHPPLQGVDKTDHATMHPGIWMSFGDINGHDYWRLKAKTEHVAFLEAPRTEAAKNSNGNLSSTVVRFKVHNRYLSTDASSEICHENSSIELQLVNGGYRLSIESRFFADQELQFGDQEEMGLGVRLASTIAVEKKLGGRILDSEGRRNGEQVWGKTARWCDYAGPLDGQWSGMTVIPSPKNFRASWSHARDYGFVAMNPFGLNAFTKSARRDVIVPKQAELVLHYAVIVHQTPVESDFDPESAYKQFVSSVGP